MYHGNWFVMDKHCKTRNLQIKSNTENQQYVLFTILTKNCRQNQPLCLETRRDGLEWDYKQYSKENYGAAQKINKQQTLFYLHTLFPLHHVFVKLRKFS